ncbi:MAG: ATPase, T2SS/T4P/T4SS family [Acidimicrobiia bacterium]|nr:ATPase, T2SS/T4P/T4SS family [Acidimicrobiia bacterium]MDX2465777.1 ATPase, T2SS/T4P/T4SS family [Acidimicrobiia bacterium]
MDPSLGGAMGVVERLARRVIADPVVMEPHLVSARVAELLPTEAPLLDASATTAVVDTVIGLGPLQPLLRDATVSDVLVNGDGQVWVERSGTLQRSEVCFEDPAQLVAAIERVIAPLGLRLDRASPAVDARLPDGSRLHAIVPPASVDGPVLAIRRFAEAVENLGQLVALGAVSAAGAELLSDLVVTRRNILICGPTGAGKTTLLNVLSDKIPDGERVVTIEDAAELRLHGHVVRLEGRPANTEGIGAISQRQLLRHALRLRPDRIIVGEVRGAEAFDMLQAMSTGHDGSMSTVHARSAAEALWRLETLGLLDPAASEATLRRQIVAVLDAVVVVGRRDGQRVVRSISEVGDDLVEVYRCS